MRGIGARTALQIGSCAACALGGWSFAGVFAGSEFGGGSVTGPVLRTYEVSLLLFAIAAVLAFGWPRLAAAVATVAGVLAVPLYAYVRHCSRPISRTEWRCVLRSISLRV